MKSYHSIEKVLLETKEFYDTLAKQYDKVAGYENMESEKIRAPLKAQFQKIFKGQRVLEIACGTGYWTKVVCEVAELVVATDISHEMMKIARDKLCNVRNVRFKIVDAYELSVVKDRFTAGFSHWWWSHIPRDYLGKFIKTFHHNLPEGAVVLHADHLSNDSNNWRLNKYGDRVEDRQLPNGNVYTVIKNFTSPDEIKKVLQPFANNIVYREQEKRNMWTVTYRVKH